MASILITDDHPLFMEGLSIVLQGKYPDLQIYQAQDFDEAKYHLRKYPSITLILLDRTFPGIDSFEHLQELWDINQNLRIAIISATCSPQVIQEALGKGVVGFIPKTHSPDATVAAIQQMLNGNTYIPNELFAHSHIGHDSNIKCSLSPRQQEILSLAAEGKTNKEIANTLALVEGTIKIHFYAIFKLLGAKNRSCAINIARMKGIIV